MASAHFLLPLLSRAAGQCVLWNERTGEIVATALEAGFDSRSRRKGLLGRAGLPPKSAFVLAPCGAVHTAFMRFAIDVLFVRRDGVVLKIREELVPWRVAFAPRAFATVELPVGAVQGSGTRVGDRLQVTIGPVRSAMEETFVFSGSD
jgi:uncharacterized protein